MDQLQMTLEAPRGSGSAVSLRTFACGSEKERKEWRLQFDRLLERLNDELELGWMSCIIVHYRNLDPLVADEEAVKCAPAEAIAEVRAWYEEIMAAEAQARSSLIKQ